MSVTVGTQNHRENEFYSFRYTTRFEKGDIVEIRTGLDLEAARFQARKSFPDVLNEYWWLKPSDVPALRNIPLKISDVYFYHGGVPVLVLLTANGTLSRKAQVFLRGKDENKNTVDSATLGKIKELTAEDLSELLLDQNLLIRLQACSELTERFPTFTPTNTEQQITLHILNGNYDVIAAFGEDAVDPLIERFFVTSNAKETERIIDTLIAIGTPALPRLDDMSEFLSSLASPYYAKRINWTISHINRPSKK